MRVYKEYADTAGTQYWTRSLHYSDNTNFNYDNNASFITAACVPYPATPTMDSKGLSPGFCLGVIALPEGETLD
jgi:hypothetical protein